MTPALLPDVFQSREERLKVPEINVFLEKWPVLDVLSQFCLFWPLRSLRRIYQTPDPAT